VQDETDGADQSDHLSSVGWKPWLPLSLVLLARYGRSGDAREEAAG
jgi:hypothetical protein